VSGHGAIDRFIETIDGTKSGQLSSPDRLLLVDGPIESRDPFYAGQLLVAQQQLCAHALQQLQCPVYLLHVYSVRLMLKTRYAVCKIVEQRALLRHVCPQGVQTSLQSL
jgi:hypothetical protein